MASLPAPLNLNAPGITPLSSAKQAAILMCPPDYFEVAYQINPWMDAGVPLNLDLAQKQWLTLKQTLEQEAKTKIYTLPPAKGLPDLVFTANAGFVYQDLAVIAHYKYPERQPEEPIARQWFEEQGFRIVTLPPTLYFEGAGDALIWNGYVFAGYGPRTKMESHSWISRESGLPVLSLELVNPRFYHIDVCLCPLSDGHCLYFPEAFSHLSQLLIERTIPADHLIRVSAEEANDFACNAVNVGNVVVFNQGKHANNSPSGLQDTLTERGFRVIPLDLSEFLKSGGSAKCLTLRVG